MIRRIFLDLDDVCNTLGPCVLHAVGCRIAPDDYGAYPRQFGYDVSNVANFLLGEARFTPTTFWAAVPRRLWANVPESDIFTTPTVDPDSSAGKMEWMYAHLPSWMHRQFAITPCKHLLGCDSTALLIDDYEENIQQFIKEGGQAILVPRPWNAMRHCDTRDYLEKKLREAL